MKIKIWHIFLLFVGLFIARKVLNIKFPSTTNKDQGYPQNKPQNKPPDQPEPFGLDDQNYALAALEDLDQGLLEGRIEDIDDSKATEFWREHANNVSLIKLPGEGGSVDGKEKMTFFHPVNTNYWPYYYYSTPYQYKDGGAWPPGMQSRLYNWEPGFSSGSGWSYWLRPGISYDRWPRNRWVRQNGSFYYINNGKDRSRDYTGEPS